MTTETTQALIERRHREIEEGATEAIRREVEWLRRHNFPVWVCDEHGNVVDANAKDVSAKEPESEG